MKRMLAQGYMPKGHKLTYREAMWLSRNEGGVQITVDGGVLAVIGYPGGQIYYATTRQKKHEMMYVWFSVDLNYEYEI